MSTVTELQRVAMRRQCGNRGQETPGTPREMLWFGNGHKVHGLHDAFRSRRDEQLPHGAKRAKLWAMRNRRRAELLNQRRSPVVSREAT